MSTRSLLRSVRLGIVALAAMTILGLVAPSDALAGCDHPLPIPSAEQGAALDLLGFADFQTPFSQRPDMPATPGPCRGAFCSGEPATPPVPLTLPASQVDRWLCVRPIPAMPDPHATVLTVDDEDARPLHEGLSLFRPPRRAA